MTDMINAQFLGGASEIGSLGLLIDINENRFLIDYGITPTKPPSYPLPPPPIDMALLTHSHLDHSGMMPWLASTHSAPILATNLTKDVAHVLYKDTVKIARSEGYASPFTTDDIAHCLNLFRPTSIDQEHHLDTLDIKSYNAGHIPGSLMYELKGERTTLFTGDFNVVDTNLVNKAQPHPCDVLFMETTYAGREHPPRPELEKQFIEKIEEVISRGGQVIVPAFAVARSQELIMVLRKAGFNVWYDGMGRRISKIFLQHASELRDHRALRLALDRVNFVYSDTGRTTASQKADVIITSSGMLDGGPVLSYVNKIKHDQKSAILLTGYQIEGTNSRLLVEKGKLDFYGVKEDISCEVGYFDFSGHAGHHELIDFARKCKPSTIVLFHGDRRELLKEPLEEFADVIIPQQKELLKL